MTDEFELEKLIDLHVDCNLGLFGRLLPKDFTGVATGKVSKGISEILKEFSFPSLNVVYSAGGNLIATSNQTLKLVAKLQEMEVRVAMTPLGKDGEPLSDSALKILHLQPCEAVTKKSGTVSSGKSAPLEFVSPDLSQLIEVIKGKGADSAGNERVDPTTIAAIVSAAASSLKLSYGLFGEEPEEPQFFIVEKGTIAGRREFSWYLRSFEDAQKEGTHFGVALLQMSRDVRTLGIKATLATDWRRPEKHPNQVKEVSISLDVEHPDVPKTPIITDFTSTDKIPITVPRDDVKTLLGISNDELNQLIGEEKLIAFGAEKKLITKGSLVELLGL